MYKDIIQKFLPKLCIGFLFISFVVIHTKDRKNKNNQTKQLKILVVIDRFPWYTKQVIINQIIGLIDRGHNVSIFAETEMPDYKFDPSLQQYNLLKKTYFEQLPPDLDTYDIIIFQYGYLGKKYCHIKNEYNLKAKTVTFFRGAEITSAKQARADEYKSLFKVGDLFLPICEYFKFRLILLGCDPHKIAVQYSGINCDKFKFKKRATKSNGIVNLITVGRLIERKGIENIIQAIKLIISKYPNLRFFIIGDGNSRKKIEKVIQRLNLQKVITLLGWKNQREIINLLYRSHIFVSHSITSKSGIQDAPINSLKEAMLTGLPVISTYHGGIIELVEPGISGVLIPERDIVSLAKAIIYLCNNPKLWQSMGKAGKKKVLEKFNMKQLNDNLEQLLLQLVI